MVIRTLNSIIEEMKMAAVDDVSTRLLSILRADWVGRLKTIVEELKKDSDFISLFFKINEIYGMECHVICKVGTFSSSVLKTAEIEMLVGKKHNDTWGNFRTHDIEVVTDKFEKCYEVDFESDIFE